MISQSGGLGFAFFDRARPRNILFRHVVTTGNEAALDVADVLDYLIDEGGTDVFLLLIEDVKSPEKFRRAADKALAAGKPLIVGKIGQSEAGVRAVASHTASLAGSQAAYRAIFDHYGLIEGRDFDEMLDFAVGFLACGDRLPAGNRIGIVHGLGRRRHLDGGCLRRRRPRRAGARRSDAARARRAHPALRHVGKPGRFDRAGRAQDGLRRLRPHRRGIRR